MRVRSTSRPLVAGRRPAALADLTVATPTFAASLAAGADISTIGAFSREPGTIVTWSPNDGRVVVAGDLVSGWRLVRGLSAVSEGALKGELVEVDVYGNRRATAVTLTCTGAAVYTPNPALFAAAGDSIMENAYNTGSALSGAAQRLTGKVMIDSGQGAVSNALTLSQRGDLRQYNDPSNTTAVNGVTPAYASGAIFGQSSATLDQIAEQVATRLIPFSLTHNIGTVLLGPPTNSFLISDPLRATYLGILQLLKASLPGVKIICFSMFANQAGNASSGRTTEALDAWDVYIAATAAAEGCYFCDVRTVGKNAGTGNGYLPGDGINVVADKPWSPDRLHPGPRYMALCAPVVAAALAWAAPDADRIAARRISNLFTAGLSNMSGTARAAGSTIVAAGTGTGSITADATNPPSANMNMSKQGSMNSNIVVSRIGNIATGGFTTVLAIDVVTGNATEQVNILPTAINSGVTAGWANIWAEGFARFRVVGAKFISILLNCRDRTDSTKYTNVYKDLRSTGVADDFPQTLLTQPMKGNSDSTGNQTSIALAWDCSSPGMIYAYLDEWMLQGTTTPLGAS